MKRVSLEEWVKALRSGEYGQTKDRLWDGKNGYCCLGVACALVNEPWPDNLETNWQLCHDRTIGDILPIGPVDVVELANMNDNGVSFNGIADWIEEKWQLTAGSV